jgi:hypothetical protein
MVLVFRPEVFVSVLGSQEDKPMLGDQLLDDRLNSRGMTATLAVDAVDNGSHTIALFLFEQKI